MAAPQKYSHIDFTPPAGARKEAELGLKLRREHGRGGTAVGIARARDIANGVNLSPSTVRRMKAFFDRHASDSKAEGFRRGEKGYPSNGKIADLLWGGRAGYAWAKKVVAQMNAADDRSSYCLDAETSTIEASSRSSAVTPNVERRYLGNFSQAENADPENLCVEHRADPNTGKKQTYLVGYAARFGKNSLLLGDFVERIAPTAFDIVEKRTDGEGKPLETRCLFNHSPDQLLGRFPTTMKMSVDEKGLRYECLLPESRQDLAELVARGDLRGSSFSFVVAEGGEKWSSEEGRSIRTVTKIKSLLDCGPVTYPAYDSATVAVAKRSYDQFVASKQPEAVEKRDSGIAARAAEEARKTQEFLAERRAFCPTGAGGGVDNSCGGKDSENSKSPDMEIAKKAKEDYDNWSKTTTGDATLSSATGALVGAAIGAIGGPAAAAAGAAIGAGAGLVSSALRAVSASVMKARMDGLKEKMKLSDASLDKASGQIFPTGGKTSIAAIDKKTIAIEQGDSIALVSDGSQFSKGASGTSFHYQPGADVGGKFDIKAVEKAAKAVGAKSVSVEAWSDKDVKSLEAKGYKQVAAPPGGHSSSKGVYEKSIKRSKRDIEELQSFLAERRAFCPTGPGGGVDNSCGADGAKGQAADDVGVHVSREPGVVKEVVNVVSGTINAGLLAGAGAAIAGPPGIVIGAVLGGVGTIVSHVSMTSKAAKKVYDAIKGVGTSESKLDKAARTLDVHMVVNAGENGSVVAESNSGFKIEFQKYAKDEVGPKNSGLYAHVENPGKAIGGKGTESVGRLAGTLVKAAREAGANHVTVKVDKGDPKTADQFEKSGYTAINAGSHWMMYRKVGGGSRRSHDELQAFFIERRKFCPTGDGGGIDNSCGEEGGGATPAKKGEEESPPEEPAKFSWKKFSKELVEVVDAIVSVAGEYKGPAKMAAKTAAIKAIGEGPGAFSSFLKRLTGSSERSSSRAFCPTGEGGGLDNSCGSGGKSGGQDGGAVAPKPGPNPNDGPKSLEQQRLEAAGVWDKSRSPRDNVAINAPYDGGDHGGFVPDYHRDVTIPGTGQKMKINVDDPEHVSQFVTLAANAAKMTPADYMKSRRMNGTPQKPSPEDKAKLFGGTRWQYVSKTKRSGGWGQKEHDDTAKRIGSTLRRAGIKGETLAHAVREYAKSTGRSPKDEMYSGLRTYQRDPGEFLDWARKRLDHLDATGKRSAEIDGSLESRLLSLNEFFHSRAFCPTGEGGGLDNSCGGSSPAGGKSSGPVRVPVSKLAAKAFKDKQASDPYGLQAEKDGKYLEWKKGQDHKDQDKVDEAQDFLDKARTDQLARGGKDGGKSDDGGGVQTWSKGDHFPWTTKQVGTDEGHVQGVHPDGSKTAKYPFKGDSSEAHKKVYEEIASKKKSQRSSVTLAEMTAFLMERAG